MGKYFVRDTPLTGLEREMMLPPNFAPRGSSSAILCSYSPHGADVDCQSCIDHRNAMGEDDWIMQSGSPRMRGDGTPWFHIHLTLPDDMIGTPFWPWREEAVPEMLHSCPGGDCYLEVWDVCANGIFLRTEYNETIAVQEAARLLADGADCVMPMGVTNKVLKAMADNHIAVFGHVGCLSGWQTNNVGGYRRTGITAEDAMKVFRQAYEYQENGMIGMTIEMTSRELTNAVAKHLRIPVVAVAAGGAADGSEMVIFDLFGFIPPQAMSQHAKTYANIIGSCIQGAATFNQEVKNGIYPPADNGWSMDEKELDKFMNLLEQKY